MEKLNRLFLFSVAISIIAATATFAGVIFEDNFDDGVRDGWFDAGQTFWGVNPSYIEVVDGDGELVFPAWQMAIVDTPTAQDLIIDVDVTDSGQSSNLVLKYIDDNNWVEFLYHGRHIYYAAIVNGVWDWQDRFDAPDITDNFHLHGEVSGSTMSFKVTDGITTYTDTRTMPSLFLNNPCRFGLIGNAYIKFDNFVAAVPDPAGTVTGNVTDSRTGNPVQGATVRIVGTANSTTTNASGEYTLSSVAVGPRVLEVSATGYVTKQVAIQVAAGNNLANVQIDPYQQIGEALKLGSGTSFGVIGIVTAVFPDYDRFAIESEDRSAGITVSPLSPGDLQVGEEVYVAGTINADGRFVMSGTAQRTGMNNIQIKPLGVNNKNIVGSVTSITENLAFTT